MRTLVVTQNMTLDGSIEMLGDWFDPQGRGETSDLVRRLIYRPSCTPRTRNPTRCCSAGRPSPTSAGTGATWRATPPE